ncbi:MAG: peptidylprolyl isomerase [Thermosynechococcaceae cyanobacterium]
MQQGIQFKADELQQAADQFREVNNLQSTEETLAWLQEYQLSVDDLETLVRDQIIATKVSNQLIAPQVETYFAQHRHDYAQIILYDVVLPHRDLAMELFCAIQEDEVSFWEIAHQYIQEPELRRSSGYPGPLSRRDLPPKISAAVFAAHPPQILKPILSKENVHLIFVEELIIPTLDEPLRSQIQEELFERWLTEKVQAFLVNGYMADDSN